MTTVVPVELRPPWTELTELTELEHDLKPGAIFVRNRFERNKYIETSRAYKEIVLSKFDEFAHICQLLGARSLEVAEVQEFSEAGDQTGLITFNAGVISGHAETGSKQFKRIAQAFRASWTWETGEPDQEQAEVVAAQSGLRSDAWVSGLLQQRGHRANRLTSHELLLDISAEAENEISFVLGLEPLLVGVHAAFTGKFDQLRSQSRTLQLKVRVLFTEE